MTLPAPTRDNPAASWRGLLDWIAGGSRARWLLCGFTLCIFLPWFFSCPWLRPEIPGREEWDAYWADVVMRKVNHPGYDYTRDFSPAKNEAKRNFRLLVPVLARLLGGSLTAVHAIRFALQAVLVVCLLLVAERVAGDRLVALGVALAVAGTYIGTEVWRDEFYWFDNCAHAFIALALVASSPISAAAAILLGLFVDERVLCAVPLVILFHAIRHERRPMLFTVAAMVPAYFALRATLGAIYGMRHPVAGLGEHAVLIPNLSNAPAAFWFSLEGGWLLVIAARKTAATKIELLGLGLFTLIPLEAAGFVGDFTRSATYVFPATFAALALLARDNTSTGRKNLRTLAAWAALVSLIVPNAMVLADRVGFESSLPVRAVQMWLRQ